MFSFKPAPLTGSGKSAIVAAVQIGLGARSTATDRAAKIDEHIMYGKRDAIISIRIRNRIDPAEASISGAERGEQDSSKPEGDIREVDLHVDVVEDDDDVTGDKNVSQARSSERNAHSNRNTSQAQKEKGDSSTYKHHLYGDSIIVERTLKRGGASTWNVRNHKGKSMKDKLGGITVRREVQNICDHFGFMVDNPVAVLTQTSAKKFLADSKPSSHHELFCKATLLGPLAEELAATAKVCEQIDLMLRQKRDNLPVIEKQITDLRVAYEESKEMKTMGDRIRDLEGVYAWTLADEEEEKLLQYRTVTKNEFEPQLQDLERNEAKLRKSMDEANADAASGETMLNDVRARLEDARKTLEASTKQHKMRTLELKRMQEVVKTCESTIRDNEVNLSAAEKTLESARNAHLGGQAHKSHLAADLSSCCTNLNDAETEAGEAEEALFVAQEGVRKASAEVPNLEQTLNGFAAAHDSKRRQAAEQRRYVNSKNHVGRFGAHIAKVMPIIEQYVQQGKFQFAPLGPVGQYLKVKDDKWAASIQDAIHPANLQTFLVGSGHDMNVLNSIFKDARAQSPKVVVVNGGLGRRRYHIPPGEIPRVHELGHCTVFDQVDVANDDVFNMLVDHCQIEGNVLVHGEKAMIELSRNRSLRNVRTCWDELGNRAYERNRSHTFRPTERNSRTGSVLGSDREAHVHALESEAQYLMEQRRAAETELNNLKRHVLQLGRVERQAGANLNRLRQNVQFLVNRKIDLDGKVAEAASEFDARPFEEAIAMSKKDLEESVVEKAAAEESVAAMTGAVKAADESRADAKQFFEILRAESKEKSARLEGVGNSIGKCKAALKRLQPKIAEGKDRVRQAHQEIVEQQSRYAKAMEDARLLVSGRPDMGAGKKCEAIDQELKSMRRKLQEEEERRDGKSAEDIEEAYLKANKKMLENTRLMERITSYHKSLKKGLERRGKERGELEFVTKKLVRTNFNLFLGTRGHKGKISFRRNERGVHELVISTQMATHKTGDGDLFKTTDLRSLSGGERSYTTLSFMLALAEVCQNPVRIMDEPDVFMDEASRNAAFRSLIDFCSTVLADRQIVLVTPLTLPAGVSPSDSVRIVRLRSVHRRGVPSGGNQARIDDFLGDAN
jgi:structural maintenance of chromosomes protein 6